jgi:hypothetical protein
MKKYIFLIVIIIAAFCQSPVKSQDINIKESVDNINNLLKENPYFDNFFEITYYYSIEITPDAEFIVRVDFDGPYSLFYKAKISNLVGNENVESTQRDSRSICWSCKSGDLEENNNCVYTEYILVEGEIEISHTDNICVKFSNKNKISSEIKNTLDSLFKKIQESELKE